MGGELFDASWTPQGPLSMDARKLVIRDPNPAPRRIVVKATSPRIVTAPRRYRPVADGARLHVYGSGGTVDSACFDLANGSGAGWSLTAL